VNRSVVIVALLGFVIAAQIDPDEPSAVASCNDLANFASHRVSSLARKEKRTPSAHSMHGEASIHELIGRKLDDRPLSGLKELPAIIAIHFNGLPTTSPHGSDSETTPKITEFYLIRTEPAAQQRHTSSKLVPRSKQVLQFFIEGTKLKARPLPCRETGRAVTVHFRGMVSTVSTS
jgi:hypothetical protein